MSDWHQQAQEQWRDPAGVSGWWESPSTPAALLAWQASSTWASLLAELGVVLFVSREYENFVVALSTTTTGKATQSHLPLPHPSGLAYDSASKTLHVACTRNPNQIVRLRPAVDSWQRHGAANFVDAGRMMPVGTDFYPGSLYLHDLVWDDGQLLGNAVGMNAVAKLGGGEVDLNWWPRAIEKQGVPDFGRNHLQLNSIAVRDGLSRAAFTASTGQVGARKPGQRHFAVDRRGVVFDAASREVAVTGLTRPHSARFHGQRLLVNDSGYGRLVEANLDRDELTEIIKLPGWTRGLALVGEVAFVGISRVLPRFSQYAPGLDPDDCYCGVVAVCLKSGTVLAQCQWPEGNQIFAIEAVDATVTTGLPITKRPSPARLRNFFSIASPTPVTPTTRILS